MRGLVMRVMISFGMGKMGLASTGKRWVGKCEDPRVTRGLGLVVVVLMSDVSRMRKHDIALGTFYSIAYRKHPLL